MPIFFWFPWMVRTRWVILLNHKTLLLEIIEEESLYVTELKLPPLTNISSLFMLILTLTTSWLIERLHLLKTYCTVCGFRIHDQLLYKLKFFSLLVIAYVNSSISMSNSLQILHSFFIILVIFFILFSSLCQNLMRHRCCIL